MKGSLLGPWKFGVAAVSVRSGRLSKFLKKNGGPAAAQEKQPPNSRPCSLFLLGVLKPQHSP